MATCCEDTSPEFSFALRVVDKWVTVTSFGFAGIKGEISLDLGVPGCTGEGESPICSCPQW